MYVNAHAYETKEFSILDCYYRAMTSGLTKRKSIGHPKVIRESHDGMLLNSFA